MRKRKRKSTTMRFTPDVITLVDHVQKGTGWSWNKAATKLIRIGAATLAADMNDAEDFVEEIELAIVKQEIDQQAKTEWMKKLHEHRSKKRTTKTKPRKPRTITPTTATTTPHPERKSA